MEMELKLLLDPGARPLVERHAAFEAVEAHRRTAETTYYDTPALDLYRLGGCLRVRRSGGGFVQTVKLDRPGDGIGSRGEWEWTLASEAPDLGGLASLPEEAAALREAAAGGVRPIFRTLVERTAWLLHREGAAIEAVIDEGTIEAGDKSLPISEVELELKEGSAAAVFRLAIDLADAARLRFGSQSKSERGYGLLGGGLPERPDPHAAALDADVSVGAAFPFLVHAALREFAAEIPAASAGDIEGIHRMRAAIRKLRSILVLVAPHVERKAARRFNAALRDLGAVLGRGRDWDVFLTETLPRAGDGEPGAETALLRPPAEGLREAAHAGVAAALRATAVTGLILGMGAWTVGGAWRRKVKADAPFAGLVPGLLDDLDRKARKRCRKLDLDDVEDLHDLRKSLKKLRYSVDYVASFLDAAKAGDYRHAIKDLLGALGDINDAAAADHRVAEIATPGRPELAPAAAALLGRMERRRAKAIGKLPTKLRRFLDIEPFWG